MPRDAARALVRGFVIEIPNAANIFRKMVWGICSHPPALCHVREVVVGRCVARLALSLCLVLRVLVLSFRIW